jgi:hypothetical protein
MHDLALAIRLLRKSPAFTLLALLCLAVGIGVNASIFSLLDSIYLRPLPVGNADRVAVLSRGGSPLFAYSEYRALRDRNQSLEGLAISDPEESDLSASTVARVSRYARSLPFLRLMTCRRSGLTSRQLTRIITRRNKLLRMKDATESLSALEVSNRSGRARRRVDSSPEN